jgi:hypothetical protein
MALSEQTSQPSLRRVRANADGVTTFIWDSSDYLAEQN